MGNSRWMTSSSSMVLLTITARSMGESWHHNHHTFPRSAFLLALVLVALVVLVAYVSAMQNATFGTLRRWSANTVIATGNLSTATRAAYRALVLGEPGAGEQARLFGTICLTFLAGAILGGFATHRLGNAAIWLAAALVAAALLLFFVDEAWVGRRRA